MSTRVKGQDVEIVILLNGEPLRSLNFARNVDFTYKLELQQEGYLGETTDRYDSVFKGIEGNIEFHFDNSAPLALVTAAVNKARRREPGTQTNIKCTMAFPSGRRARVVLRDVEFGAMPISFGSRTDYGTFKIAFGCSDGQTLPQ